LSRFFFPFFSLTFFFPAVFFSGARVFPFLPKNAPFTSPVNQLLTPCFFSSTSFSEISFLLVSERAFLFFAQKSFFPVPFGISPRVLSCAPVTLVVEVCLPSGRGSARCLSSPSQNFLGFFFLVPFVRSSLSCC